jgi:hypothetical protein
MVPGSVTKFRGVVLERPSPERPGRSRPRAGAKALKYVLAAMQEGHTVSVRTRYDDHGAEIMDADIHWSE